MADPYEKWTKARPLPKEETCIYEYKLDNGVVMRELQLPKAKQTHEIVYEPLCNSLFVSQLAESVLLRIELSDDGKLTVGKKVEAWGIGPESEDTRGRRYDVYKGTNELHNISLSHKFPGHIWLSLEVPNLLLLINATDPVDKPKLVIPLPDKDDTATTAKTKAIGSPHVVREHPDKTGDIWVGMKGPTVSVPRKQVDATTCPCCDERRRRGNYREQEKNWPDGWAVWHGKVTKNGETFGYEQLALYTVDESPAMLDFCGRRVVVSADKSDRLQVIVPSEDASKQQMYDYEIAFPSPPEGDENMIRRTIGPGVVRSPNGKYVWCSLLGYNAAFLRISFEDTTDEPLIVLYHFPNLTHGELGLRFIHFDFDPEENRMYALSSSILENDKVSDCVVVIHFDDNWESVLKVNVVGLPAQGRKAHRIHFVQPSKTNNPDHQSLLVTEFTESFLVQIDNPKSIPTLQVSQVMTGTVSLSTHKRRTVTCSLDCTPPFIKLPKCEILQQARSDTNIGSSFDSTNQLPSQPAYDARGSHSKGRSDALEEAQLEATLRASALEVSAISPAGSSMQQANREPPPGGTSKLPSDIFCFWTNKGGVGKTSMCFHAATTFALTHPKIDVIVVDLDPQANLSTALLTQFSDKGRDTVEQTMLEGWKAVSRFQTDHKLHDKYPQTILGLFMHRYCDNDGHQPCQPVQLTPDELLINVNKSNSNMPENMKLLCGDRRLSSIAETVMNRSGARDNADSQPFWVKERKRLHDFLVDAASSSNKETVVFIDTNPSLDIFTEIALVTSTKLVLVSLADHFSLISLRNIIYLLHGISLEPSDALDKRLQNGTFWFKAKEASQRSGGEKFVPKIHAIIFNKIKVIESNSTKVDNVFLQEQETVLTKWIDAIKSQPEGPQLDEVFSYSGPENPAKVLIAHMIDLGKEGVISLRCGLPLWALQRNKVHIFRLGLPAASSPDLLKRLAQVFGRGKMNADIKINGQEYVNILQALTRGRKQVTPAKIDQLLKEAAEEQHGSKRQRTK